MARKYLENAGVEIDSSIDPVGSAKEGEDRVSEWKSEIEEYGFASPELWNLDRTMLYLLFERLSMWVEKDTRYEDETRVTINGIDAKLDHWVNEILALCKGVFDDDANVMFDNAKSVEKIKKVWMIWSEISPVMWL